MLALDRATAADQAEQLQAAVRSNRRIGVAIGILMHRDKITVDHALDQLRAASGQARRKVNDIADEVILTGALPEGNTAAA